MNLFFSMTDEEALDWYECMVFAFEIKRDPADHRIIRAMEKQFPHLLTKQLNKAMREDLAMWTEYMEYRIKGKPKPAFDQATMDHYDEVFVIITETYGGNNHAN